MEAAKFATLDGNEAVASIAHQLSEVIAIYPITPASSMGELADAWSCRDRTNIFGAVPDVVQMQSEAGAAGAVHGALQTGALTTTFTASQGLLLMLPEMYKISGQLLPTVFHVSARSLATHALSIFGDHSDVMGARCTGWAMLASGSVQEAQDLALVAHAATLQSQVPFLHFFDGFRTSHEVSKIESISPPVVRQMIQDEWVTQLRQRALNPAQPVIRGTAQNPDVFFQAREAANPYYDALPDIVQRTMDRLAQKIGRAYHLFDYVGAPDAQRVLIMMGSGIGAAEEAITELTQQGEKVGLVQVRLYRPFDAARLVAALPASVRRIAVLDRTKEPGALGEPLYQDVVTALAEQGQPLGPRAEVASSLVIGGRYGLSSKEFTPAMARAVLDELKCEHPKLHFTVGIHDDVTNLSLSWDPEFSVEAEDVTTAVFYGLGSDGTVGASKNSVKIVGEETPLYAQGYFVYDSKKSGTVTVSHLRFSPRPIQSTYLVDQAKFVSCSQFNFLERMDLLQEAVPGATFLLNSPYPADQVWDHLPREMQQQMLAKKIRFFVVDAQAIARQLGLGNRINTVMQTCFFLASEVLPQQEAIEHIKEAIRKTYGRRGQSVVEKNNAAVDAAIAGLQAVAVPNQVTSKKQLLPILSASNGSPGSEFFNRVTAVISAGQGDKLPVSALPVDGTFPTGTTRFEKRSIAEEIPIWDPGICIDCGLCAYVCPHAAIRMKAYPGQEVPGAPASYPTKPWKGKDLPGHVLTVQVAPDDCTGCGVCVDVCPAKSKERQRHKAINMLPKSEHLERERANFDFFLTVPELDRNTFQPDIVKRSQLLEPLFEFSGACAGCGETPYLKLLSQLFGDRTLVANATGCSSIYGGNLPTTPWSQNSAGCGPAWCNSLFEDNAEFGLGMRLALDHTQDLARHLLHTLADDLDPDLVQAVLQESDNATKIPPRLPELKKRLEEIKRPEAQQLGNVVDCLVPRSVWIVGGDGWAYDIGFGGLDHVLSTDRNVNILVLDTGVYSNTGGQSSKATPRAAVAKFAASGKPLRKKDLGMLAVSYGHVYVAQVAMGANPAQTLRVFREAEAYPGPSLILAYSQCIAHGINMTQGMTHQKDVVKCGLWPLYHYDPALAQNGEHPFHLDSSKPSLSFQDFASQEARFAMIAQADKERARRLFALAQKDIDDQWHYYEQIANVERDIPAHPIQDVEEANS